MSSLIRDPIILNYSDIKSEVIEKHKNSLNQYYQLFMRGPSIKSSLAKIHDRYSILWDDVKYEFVEYKTNLDGEPLKYVEFFRQNLTKHSAFYYNKNDEPISQIVWWPNGIVKTITSFDGRWFCESAYHQDGKYDYLISYFADNYSNQTFLKYI